MITLEQIELYVKEITAKETENWQKQGYDMARVPKITFSQGKRFWKVIRTTFGQSSVHCFVECTTGDIYKAATWNAPAKGVRGNILNEKKPLTGCDYYNKF